MIKADTKTRIMFITPCFGYGGLERVLIDILSNLDRSRFNPFFCSLLDPVEEMYRKLERLDVPSTVLGKGEGISWSLVFRLARLLHRKRIDLVNTHDIGATLYGAPAARLAGIELIVHTDHSQILTINRLMPVYRWIMQHLVIRTITVSMDLEDYLVKEIMVDRSKIVTIPNGIDSSRFTIDRDSTPLRNELGIPVDSLVIGTIGRLTEQKGTSYLIDAFADLSKRVSNASLVIVGDGELRGDLKHRAEGTGAGDRIFFTGIRDDVPDLLRMFDVFVLSSLWEGQPITIMEAMAAGKPIVATDVGGNGEILRSGDFGLLVPAGDAGKISTAVTSLLTDRPMAGDLGERARQQAVSNLDSYSMTKRYEAVFKSMISRE